MYTPTIVQTVLGNKNATELGRILTHEHLHADVDFFYVPPPDNVICYLNNKIELNNVGFIKQYPYSCKYNVKFYDDDTDAAVLEDVKLFQKFGGGTIVENSSHGLKRDLQLMKTISEVTGINVIAGTGHYVAESQSPATLNLSVEDMYNLIVKEITEGCEECPNIKAGFIGEVGSSWPMENFEKRAIQATAEAQAQLKCPVSFHPGRNPAAPAEIIRIYEEAGGDSRKAIISHLDRTLTDKSALLEFADETKCYCQFDLFGIECSFYQLSPTIDMLSDAQRIERVKLLRDDGKLKRVLLSQDIHTKHRLVNFGGHGYAHIMNNIIPKMKIKQFSQEEIDTITMENPKEWLSL